MAAVSFPLPRPAIITSPPDLLVNLRARQRGGGTSNASLTFKTSVRFFWAAPSSQDPRLESEHGAGRTSLGRTSHSLPRHQAATRCPVRRVLSRSRRRCLLQGCLNHCITRGFIHSAGSASLRHTQHLHGLPLSLHTVISGAQCTLQADTLPFVAASLFRNPLMGLLMVPR